jgi:hypothetical protein
MTVRCPHRSDTPAHFRALDITTTNSDEWHHVIGDPKVADRGLDESELAAEPPQLALGKRQL